MKNTFRGQILVVEDNAFDRMLVKDMLQAMGFGVDIAENGLEAMHVFKRNPYDLILIDLQMPVRDGIATVQKIREYQSQMGSRRHVPVIALTAAPIEDFRDACLCAGMDDFLNKPIRVNDLGALMMRWLGPGDAATGWIWE